MVRALRSKKSSKNFPHGLSSNSIGLLAKRLAGYVRYISLDDPEKALQFGTFLIHHTKSLSQFPERGRVVPELGDDTIREILSPAFLMRYLSLQEVISLHGSVLREEFNDFDHTLSACKAGVSIKPGAPAPGRPKIID